MNITQLDGLRFPSGSRFTVSRRQFVRTTVGAMAAGASLGHAIWPGVARAAKSAGEPLPIPGGTPALGGAFHVYGPGFPGLDPVHAEPSTITDFNGFVGLAYISGTVKRTNNSTGEIAERTPAGARRGAARPAARAGLPRPPRPETHAQISTPP